MRFFPTMPLVSVLRTLALKELKTDTEVLLERNCPEDISEGSNSLFFSINWFGFDSSVKEGPVCQSLSSSLSFSSQRLRLRRKRSWVLMMRVQVLEVAGIAVQGKMIKIGRHSKSGFHILNAQCA